VSKTEYSKRKREYNKFLISLAETVRYILESVSRITIFDIDRLTLDALRNPNISEAGKSAWTVVAWHTILDPYEHPARGHKLDRARFEKIIEGDPESYYLYATILLQEPRQEVYNKLCAKHPKVAEDYLSYSKNYLIAKKVMKSTSLSWLYNW
jgi:hypothetical protein